MKSALRFLPILALFSGIALAPAFALAAGNFEVTGWLPYWRVATSTADVMPHLSELTEVNPFVYSLKSDGTLLDNGKMNQEPWPSFIAAAKAQRVRVIPTVMTSNTSLIHSLLSDATKRVALENTIASFVKANNFDGVDIDFEGKSAADKNYFSLFLKGLYQRMGNKWVTCDIEARTPVDARYYGTEVPPDATVYANDFAQINKYCDRVKFMTYDQQGVDLQLAAAAASSSQLYAPVADPVWVTKVITLAKKSIKPSKILIGVPTYGYEYDVTAYAGNQYTYAINGVFNPGYAIQIEQQYGVTPTRNTSGELMLTYVPAGTSTLPISANGSSALFAATAATAYADSINTHSTFRMLDWPDAVSVAQKIKLAQDLGVRGIAIFKLDGGEDPGIWEILQGVASGRPGAPVAAAIVSAVSSSTSTAAYAPLARDLGVGMSGEDVRTLQVILNASSDTRVAQSGPGSPGNETTLFGFGTEIAVQRFQSKYSITNAMDAAYGYVGPATRAKLNAILRAM